MHGGDRPDTRTRLLEAAVAVIEQDGEAAVRIRDVSTAAGVTYASLYHFFGDREGLIEAAQAERYRRDLLEPVHALRGAVEACRTEQQFIEALRAAMRAMCSPDRFAVRMNRMNVLGSAQTRPRLARLLADAQRSQNTELAAAFAIGRERGWVRQDIDLDMLAAWINGQSNGRVLIEMDLARADEAAWNRIAFDAVVAAATGKLPAAPFGSKQGRGTGQRRSRSRLST